MTSFDQDLIAVIDERVRLGQQTTRAVGTCIQRDTTGPWAQVIFDGSTIAMPVRVLGNVGLQENNRCILDKYNTDWFVTGAWSTFALGYARIFSFGNSTFQQATGSYTDVTNIAPVAFTKYYDLTYVRLSLEAGAYSAGTAPNSVRFGMRLTPQSGQAYTPVDLHLAFVYFNVVGEHLNGYGMQSISGVPAGDYLCQVRFYQPVGTGNIRTDVNDLYTGEISEFAHPSAPIL